MKRPLALCAVLCTACFPTLEDVPTLVSSPRILAVRLDPAEQEPAMNVSFEALVATPEGTLGDQVVSWSFCLRQRTLAERNGVASECLALEGESIQTITGTSAEMPVDACARFGPNPPPSTNPDEPPPRPADPDLTGGYYLPVRALLPTESAGPEAVEPLLSFGFARIRCSLAGAPRQVFRAFLERYTNNQNPAIEAIEVDDGGGAVPLDSTTAVSPGEEVRLRVRWPSASAERYPLYDSQAVELVDRREAMTVSWFSSSGRFASEKSGRTESEISDAESFADNRWTAPSESGSVHLWVVLRDSRGGVAWRDVSFEIR